MDFEVYAVQRVLGYGEGAEALQEFRPFYASVDAEAAGPGRSYFTQRREPRALSEAQRRNGTRTAYVGSEVFLSLVDPGEAPYSGKIRQLAVEVLVSNRDLPLLMPVGRDADFSLAVSAPVDGIRCLRGPSRPRSAVPEGELAWRLINHLSLNYLTVTDLDAAQGATALRELLELYADLADADVAEAVSRRQAQGVRRVAVTPRTRRLPVPGPLVFGRGLEVRVTVDEAALRGGQRLSSRRGPRASVRTARLHEHLHRADPGVGDTRGGQAVAAEDGRATAHLALFAALARAPWSFDFFQALRRLESLAPDRPRLGKAVRPSDEPVRLSQEASLAFAPSTLSAFEEQEDGRPPRLEQRVFGLLGPNGPLPLHLTEYARDRLRHHGDRTLVRFLDLFHHRMAVLFYRAWAERAADGPARPAPRRTGSRSTSDRLEGYGTPAVRDRDAVSDHAKRFFAGHLARHARNAEGLAAIVEGYFGVPARVDQFTLGWLELPPDQRTVLRPDPAPSGLLGQGTVVGGRVRDAQSRFRMVLGPMDLDRYHDFLPVGGSLGRLVDWVRNYVGYEFDWEVQWCSLATRCPVSALGREGRLGWTAWLGTRRAPTDAGDLILAPARRPAPAAA